jgi:hypothetical protein
VNVRHPDERVLGRQRFGDEDEVRLRRQPALDGLDQDLEIGRRRLDVLLLRPRGELLQPALVVVAGAGADLFSPLRRGRARLGSECDLARAPPRRAHQLEEPPRGVALPLSLPELAGAGELFLRIDLFRERVRALHEHGLGRGEHGDGHEVRRDFAGPCARVELDQIERAIVLGDDRVGQLARRSSRKILITFY